MESKDLLNGLLNAIGAKKFKGNEIYSRKGIGIEKNLEYSSSYFYNRLKAEKPVNSMLIAELQEVYKNVLNDNTGYSAETVSKALCNFYKENFRINADVFIFNGDDGRQLRAEKEVFWKETLEMLLQKANGLDEFSVTAQDFRTIFDTQKECVKKYSAGTHTEAILEHEAEAGEVDDYVREFYCGSYYCFYAASDSDGKIRGGKIKIYPDGLKLKVRLILRISEEYLLDEEGLNKVLEGEDGSDSHTSLKNYKAREMSNDHYDAGRCEVYEGDFRVFRTHIRIDLNHKERGYCGFILLHRISSATQRNMQGCLGYLMNIPDTNSIYMRKIAISSYKFSLNDPELWKYIGVSGKKPYLEISKSHSDNNHKFYTYVWESILKSKREKEKLS